MFNISSIIGSISLGPKEQLTPRASTPNPSSTITIDVALHPVKVLLSASKLIVQNTGKSEFSLAANTAAFASYKSVMVSIKIKSTPLFTP